MLIRVIVAVAALAAMSLPNVAVASGENNNHSMHCIHHPEDFVKGESSAARGSIYDMAGFGTCVIPADHECECDDADD